MWLRLKLLCAIGLLLGYGFPLLAEPAVLTSSEIQFDNPKQVVTASGNVQISYPPYQLTSQKINYDIASQNLTITGPAQLTHQVASLNFDQLILDLAISSGNAKNVVAHFENLVLHGETVIIQKDHLEFINSYFSTCTNHKNHYKVSSKKMQLYPDEGFFVAFNNHLKTPFLPFDLPIPTYIYGSRSNRLVGAATAFPELGTNQREGAFIRQRYGYFFNEKSTGSFEIGASAKAGAVIGFNHGVSFGLHHLVNVRFHQTTADRNSGAFEYYYDFPDPSIPKQESFIDRFIRKFKQLQSPPPAQFTFQYRFRELINNSRVSYRPLLKIGVNRQHIRPLNTFFSYSISYADVSEELRGSPFVRTDRIQLDADIEHPLLQANSWGLIANSLISHSHYKSQGQWQRIFGQIRFKKAFEIFGFETRYTKRIRRNGVSPFFFERQYQIQSDEYGLDFNAQFGGTTLGVSTDYNLENDTFRNFDLISKFRFHCLTMIARWKTVQQIVLVGFTLK